MRALTSFLPYVMPYVNGCTEPMAEQAILSACIELCGKSCLVQRVIAESAVADASDYDVEEPPQMVLVRILQVFYGTRILKARSLDTVTHAVAMRGESINGETIGSGTPTEWFARDPSNPIVSVYPPPAAAANEILTIRAAYQPSRSATSVEDTLYDDYAEDIAAGAVARLLTMPNQSFSSPLSIKAFRDQFLGAVSAASVIARVGLGAASSRIKPVRFA